MIDTLKIYNELKEKLDPEAALKIAETLGYIYGELQNTVTKEDFVELKEVVRDLTIAQKETEKRVNELAEAQKKTEQRIDELAQAQKKTEQRIDELAQAQKKTEQALTTLTRRVQDIDTRLGGLSNTVGYGLEDRSYPLLRKILKRDFQISVDKLYRKNIIYTPERFDEVNIYGEGKRNGQQLYIIGECKAQFGPRDVTQFLKLLERVKKRIGENIFPLALAYHYHPRAEEKLQTAGIKYYWSFDLQE